MAKVRISFDPPSYLYHWSEDDALRPRNAATLKARHVLVVLKVTYCSYLRFCQFT